MYGFLECTTGQYMTQKVLTVSRRLALKDLEKLFEQHDYNAFPVVDEQTKKMIGLVSKFDFLKAFAFTTGQLVPHYDSLMEEVVGDIMTEAVIHVEPITPLTRVLQLMIQLRMRSFPVLAHGEQLVGMIAREDVMRALNENANKMK